MYKAVSSTWFKFDFIDCLTISACFCIANVGYCGAASGSFQKLAFSPKANGIFGFCLPNLKGDRFERLKRIGCNEAAT